MKPGLPHHRRGPRVDEQTSDPVERYPIRVGIAVGFVLGLLVVIASLAYVTAAR
jgi:hypothetical protein